MKALTLILGTLACTRPAPAPAPPHAPSAPLDSLVLTLPDSTEVWLVKGRSATSGDGGECLERGLELRKGPRTIPVPLLYTSTLPEVVNGKLVARLSKDCVSGASYSIDTQTGQPTLMPAQGR